LRCIDLKYVAKAIDPTPDLCQDRLRAAPYLRGLCGLQHDEPQTLRDRTGVDDLDLAVLKLACCQRGRLVGPAELARKVERQNGVAGLGDLAIHVDKGRGRRL